MSANESGTTQESQFQSPEVQKLLRYLKGDTTIVFKPAFDSKTGQLTFPDAERIAGLDSMKARVLLDFLADQGILVKEPSEAFYACPNCDSRNLTLVSGCPYCNSESLKSGRAIEHLHCGHVDLEEAFATKDGLRCPKCGRMLKAIGVDYRRLGKYYRCLNCKRLVEKPVQSFVCGNCHKRTPYEETKLNNSYSYRIYPEAGTTIEKHALDLAPVNEVFEKHGFNTKMYVKVKGRSGVPHYADILAWYKEIPETEEKPDLVLDVLILKEPFSEESMSAFIMKTIDLGSQNGIIVATPDVSKLASKLASYYGIAAKGCESVAEIPGAINRILEENLPKIIRRKLGEEETQPSPRLEKSLIRQQASRTEDQLPVLLAMIYEKQGESQKTMRKLLEYLESHDKRLEGLLQRMRDEKVVNVE
jgi:uncharacterized protein YlaI/transcription initiation factor IIE alpha subunit